MMDLAAIKKQRDKALRAGDIQALAQIAAALIQHIESQNDPPDEHSHNEEYSVFRTLSSGEVKEYKYRRKRWYRDGKQYIQHLGPVRTK